MCRDRQLAWSWFEEVDSAKSVDDLLKSDKFDNEEWTYLDGVIASCLQDKATAKGTGKLITDFNIKEAKNKRSPLGRQLLYLIFEWFKGDEERGLVFNTSHLYTCACNNNEGDKCPSLADVKDFIDRWLNILNELPEEEEPTEREKLNLFYDQINKCKAIEVDINAFKRCKKHDPLRTYDELLRICRDAIKRDQTEKNDESMSQYVKNNSQLKGKDKHLSIKEKDEKEKKKKADEAAKKKKAEEEAKEKKEQEKALALKEKEANAAKKKTPCFSFMNGNCKLGNKCERSHDKAIIDEARKKDSEKKGKGKGKGQTPPASPRDKKKILCSYFKEGKCKKGENCEYSHADKVSNLTVRDGSSSASSSLADRASVIAAAEIGRAHV